MNHEAILLALILRDEDIWWLAGLRVEYFSSRVTEAVYNAMAAAMRQDGYISRDTVGSHLPDVRALDEIIAAAESELSTAKWEYHRAQVVRAWKRRAILASYNEAREAIEDGDADPDDLADQVIADVQSIRTEHSQDASVSYRERVMAVLEELSERRNLEGLPGLSTGISALDAVTGGLDKRRMYLVGARPSQAKSALLGQIADHVARSGHAVGYFSLESSAAELITRNWARSNRIDLGMLQSGMITNKQFVDLQRELDQHGDMGLWIDDTRKADLRHITRTATIWKLRHDIKAIFVDYLQMVSHKAEDRRVAIIEISHALADLSKQLDIPVVVAAQLRREVDQKTPTLGDFQESSAIEQDADTAILLHWLAEYGDVVPVDARIAKNRDGRKTIVPLSFEGRYMHFSERLDGPDAE